jgi:hypothetical protein
MAVRVEFEPFIDYEAREFIMDGVDSYNIAATGLLPSLAKQFAIHTNGRLVATDRGGQHA